QVRGRPGWGAALRGVANGSPGRAGNSGKASTAQWEPPVDGICSRLINFSGIAFHENLLYFNTIPAAHRGGAGGG
ncbi:MAG TPA: hypothetical protein VGS79_26510, partial [Puia sp.]|nr:hypothetical protein [Puia sp.]